MGEKLAVTHRYDDIITQPHHTSERRCRMAAIDRAAQFSPFAALTGYDAAIRETGRLTDSRIELTADSRAALDETLRTLSAHLKERPGVRATFFVPDERKEGGAYVTVTGRVRKLDEYRRRLILESGEEIPMDEIAALEVC